MKKIIKKKNKRKKLKCKLNKLKFIFVIFDRK